MTEGTAALVYILCFLTSSACAVLLGRSYARNRIALLFWSSACFLLLAVNNALLVVDLVLWPEGDLRIPRLMISLAAAASLIWGFVWEVEDE